MVPLASFVDQLPETERQKLTDLMVGTIPEERMTQFTSFRSSFSKPYFPNDIALATSQCDPVGSNMWWMFDVRGCRLVGSVVRALASYARSPGSIPGG